MARSLLWLVLASSWCEPAASFAPRARARRARAAVAVRAEPVNPSSRAAIDRESGYSYDPGGRIVHEDDLPPPPPMAQPEPVLMRVRFKPSATARGVRAHVDAFPFQTLRGDPRTEPAADGRGTRLLFQRAATAGDAPAAAGDLLVDGGLLLSVVAAEASGAAGPTLDVSRIAEGCGDMPKVIREKQARESERRRLRSRSGVQILGLAPRFAGVQEDTGPLRGIGALRVLPNQRLRRRLLELRRPVHRSSRLP